jgi:predicted CoA-binding protein
MTNKVQRVVIAGASDKPDRYAHQAMNSLRQAGHEVVLVNPRLQEIDGQPVLAELGEVTGPVDTVTLYVGPAISREMGTALVELAPDRVLVNPGAENPELEAELAAAGIAVQRACTLVLLATGQF